MKQIMPNTAVSKGFGLSAQLCGYHIAVKKKSYKKFTTTFAMAALLMVFGWVTLGTNAQAGTFVAHLSGKEEVPPTDTRAQGQAIFHLSEDGETIDFQLIVANIENITQAHIHLGPAGVNGPVVVWLYPEGPPAQLIPGRTDGHLAEGAFNAANLVGPLNGQLFSDLIDAIMEGNTYVNVHTLQHPPGEVRGQIR